MDALDNLPAEFRFEDFALPAIGDGYDRPAAVDRVRLQVGLTRRGLIGCRARWMRGALTVSPTMWWSRTGRSIRGDRLDRC
jgi:hypothetical protein